MAVSRVVVGEAVQYGAMEGTTPPVDLDKVRLDRLAKIREGLKARDLAGALLFDQVNVRYATDATNMQIWCLHNEVRYCFVATEGPCILFDFAHVSHLTGGLPTIDEQRPARAAYYMGSGNRVQGTRQALRPGKSRTWCVSMAAATGASPSTAQALTAFWHCRPRVSPFMTVSS